jgi:hypothetical protein
MIPLSPMNNITSAGGHASSLSSQSSIDSAAVTLINQRFTAIEKLYRDEQSRRGQDHEALLQMIHDCKRDSARLVRAERDRRYTI